MTREEQIQQAEIKYSNDTLFDGCDYIGQVAKQEAFIAGAKWADATMIKKVCEWLRANIDLYADTRKLLIGFLKIILIFMVLYQKDWLLMPQD